MTQQKESVVTPERFASGLTWSEYLEQRVQRNREKFNYNYDETVLGEDDAAAFKRLVQQPGGVCPPLVLADGGAGCACRGGDAEPLGVPAGGGPGQEVPGQAG